MIGEILGAGCGGVVVLIVSALFCSIHPVLGIVVFILLINGDIVLILYERIRDRMKRGW